MTNVSTPLSPDQSTLISTPTRDRPFLLFLMAAVFLAYLPSLAQMLNGAWPFADDAPGLLGPWREFARKNLEQGILPLWNPHSFAGLPFMANGQTAVLYPPNVVYWLLPIRPALWFDALLHNWWLVFGAYFLARALRLSPISATVVALCMALGASVSAHIYTGHMTWHAARSWLPWEILTLLLFLRSGQMKYAVLLAVCFALQVGSGYPPLVLMGAGLCAGLFVAWCISHHLERRGTENTSHPILPGNWKTGFLVFVLLTATLSAVWILPLREASKYAVHGSGLEWGEATQLSGNWRSYVRLLMPMFFNGNFDIQWSMPFGAHEEAAYIGLLPLLLAFGAPFWCRNLPPAQRRAVPWLWLLLWPALVLALGKNTPVYGWIFDNVSFFRLFRVPVRWLELWYLCSALLAGFAFEALFRTPQSTLIARLQRWVGLVSMLALPALLWALSPAGDKVFTPLAQAWGRNLNDAGAALSIEEQLRSAAIGQALVTLILGIVLWGILRLWQRSTRPWRYSLAGVMMAVVALDVLGVFWVSLKVSSRQHDQNSVQWPKAIVQRYEPWHRWDTWLDWRGLNQNLPLRINLYNGYDAMNGRRYFEFASAAEGRHTWKDMYQPDVRSSLLRVAGVTHTVTSMGDLKESSFKGRQPQLDLAERNWKLWRYNDAWPRFYLTRDLRRAPENRQLAVLKTLANQDALISYPPVVVAPDAFLNFQNSLDKPRSEILNPLTRTPNLIRFELGTISPAVLVDSEVLSPGWRAWVNGKAASLESANYLFRAVEVPRGTSIVALVYEPQSFRFGAFISLCGLAFVMAFAAHKVLYSRQERAFKRTGEAG